MTDKELEVDKYTTILGSGGFGLVVYNPSDNMVMKLIYKESQCAEASIEAGYHKRVYEKIQEWLVKHPKDQINVIKPYGYRDQAIVWNDQFFRCSYVMDLIRPIPGFKSLVHVILKEENKHILNKEVGRIYTQPISKTNPSRGFFATCDYITDNILDRVNKGNIRGCNDLARLLGLLFGISVFGARVIPKDAEYVLSYNKDLLTVTMLDFGMFVPIDLSKPLDSYVSILKYEVAEQDIYFPYQTVEGVDDSPEPERFKYLSQGVVDAAKYYIDQTDNNKEKEALEYILAGFLAEEEYSPTEPINPVPRVFDIGKATLKNNHFRQILQTNKHSQLVLMSLEPGQEIGMEVHDVDQFLRIEKGSGIAILNGVTHKIKNDSAIVVPAGTKHNVINTSRRNKLKLYTIYSPPEH
jgi:mannose-6-phosphate isomerase-like protein (cupin superfamily)